MASRLPTITYLKYYFHPLCSDPLPSYAWLASWLDHGQVRLGDHDVRDVITIARARARAWGINFGGVAGCFGNSARHTLDIDDRGAACDGGPDTERKQAAEHH